MCNFQLVTLILGYPTSFTGPNHIAPEMCPQGMDSQFVMLL